MKIFDPIFGEHLLGISSGKMSVLGTFLWEGRGRLKQLGIRKLKNIFLKLNLQNKKMFFCFFQHFSPDLPSDGGQRRREQVHVRDTRLHGEQEGGKLRLKGKHNSHKKK